MLKLYKIILLSSVILYLSVVIFFMITISNAKKNLSADSSELKKTSVAYKASHFIAALLALSPLFYLFQPFIQIAICLSGILGEFIICKERLNSLKKKLDD